MPLHSRIWVYAANRALTVTDVDHIQNRLNEFTATWTYHDMPLTAAAQVVYGRLVILAVDEKKSGVSGCGIDKSVKVMKDLGSELNIDFFNRLQVIVFEDDMLNSYTLSELQKAIDEGRINEDTIAFNPQLETLEDMDVNGFLPLPSIWAGERLKFKANA